MVPGLISDFSSFARCTDLEPQAPLALSNLTHYN